MKIINYLLILQLCTIFSCTTETDYRFQVKNTTRFNLDKIQLNGRDGIIVNVGPHAISDTFVIARQSSLANIFSEPLMVITVLEFSDSVSKYDNHIGEVISISKLKPDEVNILTFSLDKRTEYVTKKFTIHAID